MTYKEFVIILKQIKINESDKLLTLLGEKKGRFVAIVKGAQRPTSKKTSIIDIGAEFSAMFAKGKNIDLLVDAKRIGYLSNINNSLIKSALLFYILELADKFFIDASRAYKSFTLLKQTLNTLNKLSENDLIDKRFLLAFLVNILTLEGILDENILDSKNKKIIKFIQKYELIDILKLKLENSNINNLTNILQKQIDNFLHTKLKSKEYLFNILVNHN